MIEKRTGTCPECGKVFSLRKTGRLRAHGYGVSPWYASGPGCPGSNQRPVNPTKEAPEVNEHQDRYSYDEEAGGQPGPMWIGDKQLTWRECLEKEKERSAQLGVWAGMWSDLDRSQHGRHEGDAEGQDPTGVSQGNPFIVEGDIFGFNISGRPYRMPERSRRSDPDAWLADVPREG